MGPGLLQADNCGLQGRSSGNFQFEGRGRGLTTKQPDAGVRHSCQVPEGPAQQREGVQEAAAFGSLGKHSQLTGAAGTEGLGRGQHVQGRGSELGVRIFASDTCSAINSQGTWETRRPTHLSTEGSCAL